MFFPTVTLFHDTLIVPIFCEGTDPDPQLHVAPILLPTGNFVVLWSLVTLGLSDDDETARFQAVNGVHITGGVPNYLSVQSSPGHLSDHQWAMTFQNNRDGNDPIAEIKYDVNYTYKGTNYTLDPVIVVAQDPPGIMYKKPGHRR